MVISRRKFLESATSATAGLLGVAETCRALTCLRTAEDSETSKNDVCAKVRIAGSPGCGVLDLANGCALPESLLGYKAALAEAGIPFEVVTESRGPAAAGLRYTLPHGIVIVPAVARLDAGVAKRLSESLREGKVVLFESAAAFLSAGEFRAHREQIFSQFGVRLDAQVDLWASEQRSRRVPYVDFNWPLRTKMRDFSRIVSVAARENEIIGRVDSLPVALKRKVGGGTLVFLGSALGPQLRAGDAEARSWLKALIASA